jgi:predicted transcriptional regulator
MSDEPTTPPALHELESEVMNTMWRLERATVREVMEQLNESAPQPRAYTTYMTIMSRLDAKRLLQRERQGKTDVYWPAMDEAAYHQLRAEAEVAQMVSDYGDVALVHFARAMEGLDPERLKKLRRIARKD